MEKKGRMKEKREISTVFERRFRKKREKEGTTLCVFEVGISSEKGEKAQHGLRR